MPAPALALARSPGPRPPSFRLFGRQAKMRQQIAKGKVLRDPAVIPQTLAVVIPFWDERTKTDGLAETTWLQFG
jgi:hypothetical protein